MESSIAEFLMRQLASEQLPTSHARLRTLRATPTKATAAIACTTTCMAPRRVAQTHTQSLLPGPLGPWSVRPAKAALRAASPIGREHF